MAAASPKVGPTARTTWIFTILRAIWRDCWLSQAQQTSSALRPPSTQPCTQASALPCIVTIGWQGTWVRSEERRVGKEGRAGWSPDHESKKKEMTEHTMR